jgi:hypothetical protein
VLPDLSIALLCKPTPSLSGVENRLNCYPLLAGDMSSEDDIILYLVPVSESLKLPVSGRCDVTNEEISSSI